MVNTILTGRIHLPAADSGRASKRPFFRLNAKPLAALALALGIPVSFMLSRGFFGIQRNEQALKLNLPTLQQLELRRQEKNARRAEEASQFQKLPRLLQESILSKAAAANLDPSLFLPFANRCLYSGVSPFDLLEFPGQAWRTYTG